MNLIGSCCDVKSKRKGRRGSRVEIYSNSTGQPQSERTFCLIELSLSGEVVTVQI